MILFSKDEKITCLTAQLYQQTTTSGYSNPHVLSFKDNYSCFDLYYHYVQTLLQCWLQVTAVQALHKCGNLSPPCDRKATLAVRELSGQRRTYQTNPPYRTGPCDSYARDTTAAALWVLLHL